MLRLKRTTVPFQKDHRSVSKGPPFRFKRTTVPFQKDHRSDLDAKVTDLTLEECALHKYILADNKLYISRQ